MITRSYVAERALNDKRLTPTEKLVYGIIFGFAERDKDCSVNSLSIAETLDISDRQVRRIISKLADLKYIELGGNKFQREYKIILNSVRVEKETDIDDLSNEKKRTSSDIETDIQCIETDICDTKRTSSANRTIYRKKDKKDKNKKARKISLTAKDIFQDFPEHLKTDSVLESLTSWINFKKKEFNFTYKTTISFKSLCKKIDSPKHFCETIEKSIDATWNGLFPEKTKTNNYKNNNGIVQDGEFKGYSEAFKHNMTLLDNENQSSSAFGGFLDE
jgi:hypothetical protein